MFEFKKILLEDVINIPDTLEMFEGLRFENMTLQDVVDEYETIPLVGVYNGVDLIGFLSVEGLDDGIEVHACIFKRYRCYSLRVLKQFRDFVFSTTDIQFIYTTVTSDTPHVVRLLRFVGFETIMIDKDYAMKKGNLVDVTHMIKNRGE